ncbi:MAG: stage IV sporulation protein A [Anaerovoracaceae bacterium]
MREVVFRTPGYMEGLERDHWLKSGLMENIKHWADSFSTAGDIRKVAGDLADGQMVESAEICMADMGTGEIGIRLNMAGNLYYRIITELMGENVANDHDFFTMLREFASAKKHMTSSGMPWNRWSERLRHSRTKAK